ncbi:MAG: flagellar filament capping protein FliD [Acidobacteriota bacterium]|nr:flagellar filament capping protein FliD [Acidobacteriota bacterium]
MGAIGLNFGSPTSGTGFDVSSTVAAIVSNLRAVESPWKNQLTSLQSQDTVLSNLGTLFSNLSNDLSALTDFQGALAQKTGSSSNTNVLELASASSSATAGTHTVVVNNLAQTSSGYLDPLTNASDTLAGSISIQVGSGSTTTINIDSTNNNLSGLAAAINSSNAGVTATVLKDSSGSRLSIVSGTSGAQGNLAITSSITDTTAGGIALSYNSAVSGLDASLQVDGISLTSSSNTVSNLIPGVTFQLLSSSPGTPIQVVIGNYTTGVESAIGTFVSDYNALISAINTQQGNDSSGNAQPLYGSPTLSLLQQQLLSGLNAQNPNGFLDTITNSSDTLSGSLTIQVGSGTAQTINIDSSNNTLSGLASSINAANIGVNASVVTDSTGSRIVFQSQLAGSNGALTVSSSISDASTGTDIQFNSGNSDINGLSALGINIKTDGSLSVDATRLDGLLNSDYNTVVGFFQNANSWGKIFTGILNSEGESSSTGVLKLAITSNSNIEANLNSSISREESFISTQEKSLTAELTSVNQILQSLPTQLNNIDMIYSAITGYNPKG